MTDTGNELSEILSEQPVTSAVPAAETAPIIPDNGQPRAADGTFAPKAGDAPAVEPPVAERPGEEPNGAMVPQQALHAERQKNRSLETQMAEMKGRLDAFLQQQPKPATPAPPPKVEIDAWADPTGHAKSVVSEALNPVQEQIRAIVFDNSKERALRDFGAEKIAAAETAMKEAIEAGRLDGKTIAAQLSASRHPVGDVVNWHLRQSALTKVGNDPDAWLEAEMEKRLNDPAQQAKILERIQQSAAQTPNRSAPPIKLPPSLHQLPGGTNTAAPAIGSDSERFAAAIAR